MSEEAKKEYDTALAQAKAGENPSGLDPVEYCVVVLPVFVGQVTEGGIYIPDQTHERERERAEEAHIVAVSDMAFTLDGEPWPCRIPKQGERVVLRRYAGSKHVVGKVPYRIVQDKDIMAVVS